MLAPDGKIKSSSKKSDLVGQVFHGYLASEVGVDCSNATVLADNLSEGITAYDANGTLITGTGVDNVNNYNLGYADGLANALTNTKITYYIGHRHNSSCYKEAKDYCHCEWHFTYSKEEDGRTIYVWECSRGHEGTGSATEVGMWNLAPDSYAYGKPLCGVVLGSHMELICTKNETDIIRTISSDEIEEGKNINDYLENGDQVIKIEVNIVN